MGHGPGRPVKTRGRPHGHGGCRSSSNSTPHLMGSSPGRPIKTHGPPHEPGGAAHIEPTSHGPRPGPAHQISRGWAAARPDPSWAGWSGPYRAHISRAAPRPGPSNFERMGRGLARSIKTSEDWPQPDLAHHISNFSRPGPSNFQKSRPGPARPRQTAHNKPCIFCHRRGIEIFCRLFSTQQRLNVFVSDAWSAPATYHRPFCEHCEG